MLQRRLVDGLKPWMKAQGQVGAGTASTGEKQRGATRRPELPLSKAGVLWPQPCPQGCGGGCACLAGQLKLWTCPSRAVGRWKVALVPSPLSLLLL